MYHPTTRVLTVLELLQAHPLLSSAELAARLEVSQRSIRRYIAMLQDMGIPVEAVYGSCGGYRLRPGFKLPPLMLSDEEALAILLGLQAARRQGVAADPAAVEGALAKIERVLPGELRERLQAVQSAVESLPPAQAPQPGSALVMTFGVAVQQSRSVLMRYRAHDGSESERSFEPYGLVSHWAHWYAVGWCRLRDGIRVFRLDRVVAAALEERGFVRPAGFDSMRAVLDSVALAPRRWSVEALLDISLELAQRRIMPGVVVLEQAAGGVLLRAEAEDLERVAQGLVEFGCPFVVRGPPELREVLRRLAATILAAADAGQEP